MRARNQCVVVSSNVARQPVSGPQWRLRALARHLHLHCVVTGDALAPDGSRWIPARRRFLFPVRALSKVFRGKFLAALQGRPMPHQSGETERERGVGKDGNRHVQGVAIELAWAWLRFPPESALSRWYQRRFGHGSKRLRKSVGSAAKQQSVEEPGTSLGEPVERMRQRIRHVPPATRAGFRRRIAVLDREAAGCW